MVDGVLYMWVRNLKKDGTGSSLAWSNDHAKSWTWADWSFPEIGYPTWLNAGRNYEAAEDKYVYCYSPDTPSAYKTTDHILLARVPLSETPNKAAYRFFAGMNDEGEPKWTADFDTASRFSRTRDTATARRSSSIRGSADTCCSRQLPVLPSGVAQPRSISASLRQRSHGDHGGR